MSDQSEKPGVGPQFSDDKMDDVSTVKSFTTSSSSGVGSEADRERFRTLSAFRGKLPVKILPTDFGMSDALNEGDLLSYPTSSGSGVDMFAYLAGFHSPPVRLNRPDTETSDMDHKHRQLLNRFGLFRHAILQSSRDPQQRVHVVYGGDSTDFDFTQLTQELETRAGLRLVLPDKGDILLSGEESPFFAALHGCRQTLIIFGEVLEVGLALYGTLDNPLYQAVDQALYQAVKQAVDPLGQTVFMQIGRECPKWVSELETCTVMFYPHYPPERETAFWDNLSLILETFDMDHKRRQLLNRFGLVRHAVLQSSRDPQQRVHVVYGGDSTDFVLTQLTQELETRAGLRLVLPAKGDISLSGEESPFFAALQGCRQTLIISVKGRADGFALYWAEDEALYQALDKALYQTVKETVHPLGQTVFIQSDWRRPYWVNELETCTVMFYPHYPPERETAFWDNLSLILGGSGHCYYRQNTDSSPNNDNMGDQWEPYSSGSSASSTSNYVSLDLTDPLTTADTDSPLCSYPSWSDTDLSRPAAVASITRRHSVNSGNTDTLPSSNRSFSRRRQQQARTQLCTVQLQPLPVRGASRTELRHALNAKVADEDPLNTLAVDLGKFAADSQEVKDVPSPIFSRSWQAVISVSTAGGTLRKAGSDVMIEVPAGAVDDAVAVHTAVCTDTDRVASVLGLQGCESVCSPLAEYWAGHDFRFQKPLRITLPHFLPPNPDPRLVRVYCLTGRPDGHIAITRLRQPSASRRYYTQSRDPGTGDISMSLSCPTGGRQAGRPNTEEHRPGSGQTCQVTLEVQVAEVTDNRDVLWEDTTTFQLTSDGSIYVTTDHLSGYVCTYCGDGGPPVLNVLACGGYRGDAGGHQTAQISVHVWDGRLHINDFRQDYGIAVQSHILTSSTLDMMPALPDSRLHMLLRIGRLSTEDWQLSLDDTDQLMTPAHVCRELRNVLTSCYFKDCPNSAHNTCPISAYWMLETQQKQCTGQNLTGVIKLCQVSREQIPAWSNRDGVETYICLPVELPKRKGEFEASTQTDNTEKYSHTFQLPATPLFTVGQWKHNSYADSQPISTLPQVYDASGHHNGGHNTQLDPRASGEPAQCNGGHNPQLKQWTSGSAPQCDGAAGGRQMSSPPSIEGALVAQQMGCMAESIQRHFLPGTCISGSLRTGVDNAGHSDNLHSRQSLQAGHAENHDQHSTYASHQTGCYGNGHVATTGVASLYPPMFPVYRQGHELGNGVEHFEAVNSIKHYPATAVGAVGGRSTAVVNNYVQHNYNYNPISTHNNNVGKVQGEYNVAGTLHSSRLVKHSDRSLKGSSAQHQALEGPRGVGNGEETAFVDFDNELRDLPAGFEDGCRPNTTDQDIGARSQQVQAVTSRENETRTPSVAPVGTSESGAGRSILDAGHEYRNHLMAAENGARIHPLDVESRDITSPLVDQENGVENVLVDVESEGPLTDSKRPVCSPSL